MKFEEIAKQIDAMLEILNSGDITAQDAKNIALTVLEWDKEYPSFANYPVKEATSLAFLIAQGLEENKDWIDYSRDGLRSGLESLRYDMDELKLNAYKISLVQSKLSNKKRGRPYDYEAKRISVIDKLLKED